MHAGGRRKRKPLVRPVIQLAILLDTSNSMDGLIDQARSSSGASSTSSATARKGGVTPELQVALYEYGNDGLPAERRATSGWSCRSRRPRPRLRGAVRAEDERRRGVLRPGDRRGRARGSLERVRRRPQGRSSSPATSRSRRARSTTRSCAQALARGIIVNTIFCGDQRQGLQTQWSDGAMLADGRYMASTRTRSRGDRRAAGRRDRRPRRGAEQDLHRLRREGRRRPARQSAQDQNLEARKVRTCSARSPSPRPTT